MSSSIPAADSNWLWIRSRGVCAFPSCQKPLVERDRGGLVTQGERAHIRADAEDGPRYDPLYPHPNSYENLLLLCRQDHRRIDAQPEKYGVAELEAIKRAHEGPEPTASFLTTAPPPVGARYVRREKYERVVAALASDASVVLTGMAGVGKTQLAGDVFRSLVHETGLRLWVRSRDPGTLRADFASIGQFLGVVRSDGENDDDYCTKVRFALEQIDGWLLVFDDAPDEAAIGDFVPRGAGTVLVTSQSTVWTMTAVALGAMTVEESEAVLRSSHRLRGASQQTRDRLIEASGSIPLALSQICGFSDAAGLAAEEVAALCEERTADLLERGQPPDHEALAASIIRSTESLELGGEALLGVLAYLAPEPLPVPDRLDWLDDSHFPAAITDRILLEDAIVDLRRFSLVERDESGLQIHAAVQTVVRARHTKADADYWAAGAMAFVAAALPERVDRQDHVPAALALIPHANALVDHFEQHLVLRRFLAQMLSRLAAAHALDGRQQQAESELRRALELARGDDETTATVLHNLANCVADRGALEEAVELGRQALELKREVKADPTLIAYSMQALGQHLDALDLTDEALLLHIEAGLILSRSPTAAIRDQVDAQVELGRTYRLAGRTSEAIQELTLAVEKASSDDDSWREHAEALVQLAFVFQNVAPEEGIRCASDAIEIVSSLGVPCKTLAGAFFARGHLRSLDEQELVGAATDLRTSLELSNRFEPNSANRLRTLGNLGLALVRIGVDSTAPNTCAEGLRYLQDSLNGLERDYPDDIVSLGTAQVMLTSAQQLVGEAPVDLDRSQD